MSFCPECCGMCDVKHIQLKQKEVDEVCYFECPRCNRIFKLVVVEDEDDLVNAVHKSKEIFP